MRSAKKGDYIELPRGTDARGLASVFVSQLSRFARFSRLADAYATAAVYPSAKSSNLIFRRTKRRVSTRLGGTITDTSALPDGVSQMETWRGKAPRW